MRARPSIEALDVTSFSTSEPVPVVGGPDSGDQVQVTPIIVTIPIITATIVIADP